jgi:4-hydroxy-tetrahydrodipicolinate synthase
MELAAIETNPIPIKCALSLVGKPSGPCRLPLSPLSLEHYQKLEHYFKEGEIHSQLKEDLVIN